MESNKSFEIKAETTATFDVFFRFFNSVQKRRSFPRILIELSPYLFLTGLFFCLLNMIVYKDDELNGLFLVVVILLGLIMVFLYIVPPRSAYNIMKREFSLPYKYLFTEKGFSVGRLEYETEKFVEYKNLDLIFETESSFYFSYRKRTCIIEKSGFVDGNPSLLSDVLKAENPEKYIKLKT